MGRAALRAKAEDPIGKFKNWWEIAINDSPLKQLSAACVSTIDDDGYPAARFVDLKSVSNDGFVFCTNYDSNKGRDLARRPKTAMTIWWDHVGFQVRVTGVASSISNQLAAKFWESRSREAKLTTLCFRQSRSLEFESELELKLEKANEKHENTAIQKPENWGGYTISPQRIEFLTFNKNRLHLRELFEKSDGVWVKRLLQP